MQIKSKYLFLAAFFRGGIKTTARMIITINNNAAKIAIAK